VSGEGIAVVDNGRGLAPEAIAPMLDYIARTSSREAYVSPTRGAQGNALQTILAMPFALDNKQGETLIESRGVAHRVIFSVDPIRQKPRIEHAQERSSVKIGTRITVKWPNSASSILDDAKPRFLQVADDFGWVNPHLSLSVDWDRGGGDPTRSLAPPTDADWRKWRPSDPTSPHWYDTVRLGRLIGAHIAHAEDHNRPCQTVREFVSEFRGLSATAKAKSICEGARASRLSLAEFYGNGDSDRVEALLDAMKGQSRPIKPQDLGVIGRDHLLAKFKTAGVAPESFDYRFACFEHRGLPYVAEAAFGYCPDDRDDRRIVTGVNWSPAIGADPFRSLGPYGESLDSVLTRQRAERDEPVVAVLHLACPQVEYLDRGKSSIAIPGSGTRLGFIKRSAR
jgi:DNA topoisomerase VI subunit B